MPSSDPRRPNPGYVLTRTGESPNTTDHFTGIAASDLRYVLHQLAAPSQGADPIPFAWIGQSIMILAQPKPYSEVDLEQVAALAHVEGVPENLATDTDRFTITGFAVILPGGIIQQLVLRDTYYRRLEEDPEVHHVAIKTLVVAAFQAGALHRDTALWWTWSPVAETAPASPQVNEVYIGRAVEWVA